VTNIEIVSKSIETIYMGAGVGYRGILLTHRSHYVGVMVVSHSKWWNSIGVCRYDV
jgi:hypothetical protein